MKGETDIEKPVRGCRSCFQRQGEEYKKNQSAIRKDDVRVKARVTRDGERVL